jgi:hypothetical protein
LPGSRLIVIDHCGHAPHQECPAEVIAALKEFAQKTSDDVSPPIPSLAPSKSGPE